MYSKEIIYFFRVVSIITTVISIYSFFYLGLSYSTLNFIWTLSFFAFSMLCLILADRISTYLLGWDGLGASSFLLILYYNTLFRYRSGLATFLTNRLGDVFIILSFILLARKENIISTLQFYPIKNSLIQLAFLLIILGAATKSAQLPFSAWLPAAIAAPTPVSALVHSSTLVTAGIYIIYRYDTLIDSIFSNMSALLSLVGIVLSLLAGLIAFYERDFKKLVAMSTLSQLGILIYILFQKQSEFTLLHIISHAFFKSLLFLVVGFLIIVRLGIQDTRTKRFNKMIRNIRIILLLTTSLRLIGFIFTPGFFSKDLILSRCPEQGINVITYILLLFSCILTVMYSTKSFIIIINNIHSKQNTSNIIYDSKFVVPSLVLFFLIIIFGYYFFFIMLEAEIHINNFFNKTLGLLIITVGLAITYLFYKNIKKKKIQKFLKNLLEKFSQIVNMNWISNNIMSSIVVRFSKLSKTEMLWIEILAENKTIYMIQRHKTRFSKKTKKYSNIELVILFITVLVTLLIFSFIL